MLETHLSITQKSLLYAIKAFVGTAFCWYALRMAGIPDPIWAVITVLIVSDPDFTTTITLSKTRLINTIVGCLVGIISLLIFGYSPLLCLISSSITMLIITSLKSYLTNWRLAPVTVAIVIDAGRQASTKSGAIQYALMRVERFRAGASSRYYWPMPAHG